MKLSKSLLTFVIVFIVIGYCEPSFSDAGISVDHVEGLSDGKVRPGVPLKIHIRWTNNNEFAVNGGTPSYRIYLRNNVELVSAEFEPISIELYPYDFSAMFDGGFFINYFSADGLGSDSVGVGGFTFFGPGLAAGFDDNVFTINTSVSKEYAGDSLCIDSTFTPPTSIWLWNSTVGGSFVPDWSGPHCYEILPSCCVGIRGNIDNSPDDQINIADLNYLVQYMFFSGPAFVCPDEADIDNDGSVHIQDLVTLVNYMFLGGPPPLDCF